MASDIERIKEAISIVDVIQKYVPDMNKNGRLWKANCPFHEEKTPSFIVDDSKQRWHCFGSCNMGGDVIEFIKQFERCEFLEALKICAKIAGIEINSRNTSKDNKTTEKFTQINLLASNFFSEQLQKSSSKYLEYVKQRGISEKSINEWSLGCTPSNQNSLINFLSKHNIDKKDILSAGLAVNRSDNENNLDLIDRFRNKLMIPISNPSGAIIGFGARTIDSNIQPKYLNSPASPTFDKKSVLFGINKAIGSMRKKDEAIIVEGYFDVISCHQQGFTNVVASMGTAISGIQLRSLTKTTKNIIFALDGDSAGISAALKGITTASQELESEGVASIDWKGLVSLQEKFSAKIKIASIPAGKDPDNIVQESTEQFIKIINSSQYIADYLINSTLEKKQIIDPVMLSEAINQVIPSVAEITDPIVRAHYTQKLARLGKVDESYISQLIINSRKKSVRIVSPSGRNRLKTTQLANNYGPEEQILRLIMLGKVKTSNIEEVCDPSIFENSMNKELFLKLMMGIDIIAEKKLIDEQFISIIDSLINTTIPNYSEEEIIKMIEEIASRIKILRKKDILKKQAQDIAEELMEKRITDKDKNIDEIEPSEQANLEISLEGLSEQTKKLFKELRSEPNEVVE
ncbi:MAG: DNA primase [Chloroflexi bacterium]|nr:MAG: DNA primase [Chloroflexota bacterium]